MERSPPLRFLLPACLLFAFSLPAIQPPAHDTVLVPLPRAEALTGGWVSGPYAAGSGWARFQVEAGPGWSVRLEALTGRPAVARGRLPWVPGAANDLARDADLAARFERDPEAVVVEKGLDFVRAHPELFGVDVADLAPSPFKTGPALGGHLWFLAFDYRPHAIPAEGAEVFFRLNRGNLVQFGSMRLLPASLLDPKPRVAPESAVAVAAALLGPSAAVRAGTAPGLVWVPVEEDGELAYRLAWRAEMERAGDIASWTAHVDAHTGELLGLEDANQYLCPPEVLAMGRITGGVRPIDFYDDEEVRPLPYVSVRTSSGTRPADGNGLWSHPGGEATAPLGGDYGWVSCIGCQNPVVPSAKADATGDVAFGAGGDNFMGNGLSTRAGRTAYFHVMRARSMAEQWLPANGYLGQSIHISVNINNECNAYYTSSTVNFFRHINRCNNMGEIPGVVHHEWGHGLDHFTGGLGGDRSEGFADHIAWLSSHDPRIGPGFIVNGAPVRNVDEDVTGVKRYANCGGGGWIYCVGECWGQAGYHLTRRFRERFGDHTGWRMYETLFFSSIQGFRDLNPNSSSNVYEAYAVVLDDDGDLGDGEIHFADLLNEALDLHGLAPAAGDQYKEAGDPCNPVPDAPVPILTVRTDSTTGRGEVFLSWSAVTGADGYEVLRSQLGDRESLIRVGETGAETTFTDPGLVQGATYHYAVMPRFKDNPFCQARIDHLESVTVDQVHLVLEAITLEGPGGADGVWMPGETVEIRPTVGNTSGVWVPPGATADNVTATLVPSDPEPNLLADLVAIGTVAPAASITAAGTWVVELPDDPFLCGRTFNFLAALEADQGCWDDGFSFTIGAGGAEVVVDDLFIDDSGPGGNANGVLEPRETGLVRPVLRNRGTMEARSVVFHLSTFDPRVQIDPPSLDYGDIPAGGAVTPQGAIRVTFDHPTIPMPCGDRPTLFINVEAENGCWRDQLQIEALHRDVLFSEDFERPVPAWSIQGGATGGRWIQTNPMSTGLQPEDDTTPDPGVLCWVTGNPIGGPEDSDVDGGCTVLVSPVWDMGAVPGAMLEYQRFYTLEGVEDDELLVEISNDGGGAWTELERLDKTTRSWEKAAFDLDTVLGGPADRLRLRVTACDGGVESLVEAGLDDVMVSFHGCEDPAPRPELLAVQWVLDDGILGGSGDADGVAEPGETLEVGVQLRNVRNAGARVVSGVLSLASPVAGVNVTRTDSAWPDIPAGAAAMNEAPRFQVELEPGLACGTVLPLRLVADYEGDAGAWSTTSEVEILVGTLGPGSGPEEILFDDTMDLPGTEGPWIHADVWNVDDWERGDPFGLQGDPNLAVTPDNVWGNSLGCEVEGLPTGGPYVNNCYNFLESWPIDLSRHGQTILEFQRWLTLAPGDQARVMVGGEVVWAAPGHGVEDVRWVRPRIDVSAAADGRSGVTIRFELETDAGETSGGWNIDDVRLTAIPAEMICDPACNSTLVPDPVPSVLRVGWSDRAANRARLAWEDYSGNSLQFRVYRLGAAADLPPGPGSPLAGSVAGESWDETDSVPGLGFYEVTALNPCGVEEIQQ